jgi:hypothetical protein
MTVKTKIAVQNCLLFVMDKDSGEVPESMDGLVAATPSCIAVGTLSGADGKTSVTLSDDRLQGTENLKKVYSGILETPKNIVQICTVLDEAILTLRVPNHRSAVEIWANSENEPDELCVLILDAGK